MKLNIKKCPIHIKKEVSFNMEEEVLKSSGKPEEEVAREPEKKKSRFKPAGRN